MSNNGKWTYADMDGRGWCEPMFETKEQAIEEAIRIYSHREHVAVGQIREFCGTEYVENQETVETGYED